MTKSAKPYCREMYKTRQLLPDQMAADVHSPFGIGRTNALMVFTFVPSMEWPLICQVLSCAPEENYLNSNWKRKNAVAWGFIFKKSRIKRTNRLELFQKDVIVLGEWPVRHAPFLALGDWHWKKWILDYGFLGWEILDNPEEHPEYCQ